jgi:hypothetical protein
MDGWINQNKTVIPEIFSKVSTILFCTAGVLITNKLRFIKKCSSVLITRRKEFVKEHSIYANSGQAAETNVRCYGA